MKLLWYATLEVEEINQEKSLLGMASTIQQKHHFGGLVIFD
jgi:hypothetical protein